MSAVVQLVRFRAKDGVDHQEMLALNERFQREVAPQLRGLERREATISTDGEWVLVLRYADMETATAPPTGHGNEVAGQFLAMIDKATMSASFQTIVSG